MTTTRRDRVAVPTQTRAAPQDNQHTPGIALQARRASHPS
jgi:hypothetical protein